MIKGFDTPDIARHSSNSAEAVSTLHQTSQRTRVCIVTPGQIGSNPRVVKEAYALHEAGFEVTVLATRTLDGVEPRDLSLMKGLPWRLERLDLRSKWRWRVRRAVQLSLRRAYRQTARGVFADFGFSAYTSALLGAAVRTPADLYIAHYPAALPVVSAAARHHGALYAYDAEDFHLGDWRDDPKHDGDRKLVGTIEQRYLPDCAYVTAASPGIADEYVGAYGITRPQVILNAFSRTHAPPAPTLKGTTAPGPSLYWFSQVIGPDRGLECAARAMGLSKARPHLYLRGAPVPGYLERLSAIAAEFDAAPRLHILPPDEPSKMECLAAAYDIGLVLENRATRNRAIALTNKLFTFLIAGIPAIMSDIPAHKAFAAEAGMSALLYSVDDPKSLAEVIDSLLLNPAQLAAARADAYRLGQEQYNWERESKVLLNTIQFALEPALQGRSGRSDPKSSRMSAG